MHSIQVCSEVGSKSVSGFSRSKSLKSYLCAMYHLPTKNDLKQATMASYQELIESAKVWRNIPTTTKLHFQRCDTNQHKTRTVVSHRCVTLLTCMGQCLTERSAFRSAAHSPLLWAPVFQSQIMLQACWHWELLISSIVCSCYDHCNNQNHRIT